MYGNIDTVPLCSNGMTTIWTRSCSNSHLLLWHCYNRPFSQIIFNEAVSKQCQQSLLDLGNLSTNRVSFVQSWLSWSHFFNNTVKLLVYTKQKSIELISDKQLFYTYVFPHMSVHLHAGRDWNEQSRVLHAASIIKVLVQYALKFFSVLCIRSTENQYSFLWFLVTF